MSDYIKREEALDAFTNAIFGEGIFTENLANIPAADVRPNVRGEWVADDDGDGMHCSLCKTDFCYSVCGFVDFNFCPNCGAEMRGDGDD